MKHATPPEQELLGKTKWTMRKAKDDNYQPERLYFRGLLPANWVRPLMEDAQFFQLHSANMEGITGRVYTDGAGPKVKHCRQSFTSRVAAAAVGVTTSPDGRAEEAEFVLGGVPGRQTIPRAELCAAGWARRFFTKAPGFSSDSAYVVNVLEAIE